LLLRGEEREVILGDLDEEYVTEILPLLGERAASHWYRRQALASIAHAVRRTVSRERPRRRSRAGNAHPGRRAGDALWQDLRFAARVLRRQPGWAAVAILTVALGIAANTTIFTVVNTVLLEPLPYEAPDRLVLLWNRTTNSELDRAPIAAPDVADYREQAELFEAFAFSNRGAEVALTGDGPPEQIILAAVTSNFFSVLGVNAVVGRTFHSGEGLIAPAVPEDSTAAQPPSPVILSHGLWQQRFGSDPAVSGRSVSINGNPFFVVGVLPQRFEFLVPPDAGIVGNRHQDGAGSARWANG
jgi:hypothetical protein